MPTVKPVWFSATPSSPSSAKLRQSPGCNRLRRFFPRLKYTANRMAADSHTRSTSSAKGGTSCKVNFATTKFADQESTMMISRT